LSSISNDYEKQQQQNNKLKQKEQKKVPTTSDVTKTPTTNSGTTKLSNLESSIHRTLNTSLGSSNSNIAANSTLNSSYHLNISQENENLEEDMRKAKESADMLRSVVLPLETEISVLRTRSNTSESRIKELEKIIEEVNPKFFFLFKIFIFFLIILQTNYTK
jgi:hypothetical protein